MGRLAEWILHRAALLGLSFPQGISEVSGIERQTLESILAGNSLRRAGRSARGYLARAMNVSLRDLEALDAGRRKWIADDRQVKWDRLSPLPLTAPNPGAAVSVACPRSRGMAVMGRVMENGRVAHFGEWSPEDGPRLPIRFSGIPDAFALRLEGDVPPHCAGAWLVFQPIVPGTLQDGDLALIARGEAMGESDLGVIEQRDATSVQLRRTALPKRESMMVPLVDILRAARQIGVYSD